MKMNHLIFGIILVIGLISLFFFGQKKKEYFFSKGIYDDSSIERTGRETGGFKGFSAGQYLILPYDSSINRQTPFQPILSKLDIDIITTYNNRAIDRNAKSKSTFLFTMYVYLRNMIDGNNDTYTDISIDSKNALKSMGVGTNSSYLS